MREPDTDFPTHFEQSLRRMRGALTELLASVGAAPSAPHVPRPAGTKLLLGALGRGGAAADVVHRAHVALEGYEELVRLHAGDRASLELLLSSLMPDRVAVPVDPGRRRSISGPRRRAPRP